MPDSTAPSYHEEVKDKAFDMLTKMVGVETTLVDLEDKSNDLLGKCNNIQDRLRMPVLVFPWFYDSITSGEFVHAPDANYYCNAKFYNSSNNDGDQVDYEIYLGAGTYTFKLLHAKNTNFGIIKLLVDDVEKGSIDSYAASAELNVISTITGVEIASSGVKTVSLKIDGKNGSSTGYYLNISAIYIYKTA